MPEQIQVPNLPDVEIVDQNGKRLDTSAIDNYDSFMGFLVQASAAKSLLDIKKHIEDRTSQGKKFTFLLSITPNTQEIRCPSLCQTLYIENNGPGQIFVAINSLGDITPIAAGREAYFPYETHVIESFFVWSAGGTVATATAIAKY